MAGETVLTVVGNLTADPELRFPQAGVAVTNFTIAATPREFKNGEWGDGKTLFMRCTAWRDLGQNVAGSLVKGTRVLVQGRLVSSEWETEAGEKRSSMQLEVDAIGPDLRYATATVQRVAKTSEAGWAPSAPQVEAPAWNDETPF